MKDQPEAENYSAHAVLTDLKDCSIRRDLQWGRRIHAKAVASRSGWNLYVVTAVIKMYAKCGSMVEARRVFDSIHSPDVVSWTALILGYADNGHGRIALDLFSRMKARGFVPDSVTYIAALKACTSLAGNGDGSGKNECLERGRQIHTEIGWCSEPYVQNALISMYGKCGGMVNARRVFESISEPDVVSWSALVLGYAENGDGHNALDLFQRMKVRGYAPNSLTYVAALKACTCLAVQRDPRCLEYGRGIHAEIGGHLNHYVKNTLMDMYAKLGIMADARRLFDGIQLPCVVSWNVLLLGYAENGDGITALGLFSRMKASGCPPDSVTYVAALKACTSLLVNGDARGKSECLERVKEIHSEIGCHLNHYVQSSLIDMYAKCGSMVDARRVFDGMHKPVLVSWNALILGYAENGDAHSALDLLSRMKLQGCAPDSVTYIASLKACSLIGALALGRKLHSEITEFTAHIVTCLVDFYAKCGSMVEAREVFDLHSRVRDVSTWNALLSGYGNIGDTLAVFKLFEGMEDVGTRPNAVTFVSLLLSCSHAGLVERAREYFEAMPVRYCVTPAIIHYNCMVDVLGRANKLKEALAVLQKMPCNPDAVTWRVLLSACHKWKDVEIGRIAFQSLVDLDKKDASAYILMAHIYGSRGMREEQRRVLETGSGFGASGQTYGTDECTDHFR